MRRIAAIVLAAAVLAPSMAGAAVTLEEKFEKALAKQTVSTADVYAGKWKALCTCKADRRAGVLTIDKFYEEHQVTCTVLLFDAGTGAISTSYQCNDYVPLVK